MISFRKVNKKPIEDALAELKTAHKEQNLTAIDAAMEKLNTAWQNASQEMYQAAGADATGGPTAGGPGAGGPGATGNANGNSADGDVADVEYEEVNDTDTK